MTKTVNRGKRQKAYNKLNYHFETDADLLGSKLISSDFHPVIHIARVFFDKKYNSNPSLASINNLILYWGGKVFSNIHIKNSNFYDDDGDTEAMAGTVVGLRRMIIRMMQLMVGMTDLIGMMTGMSDDGGDDAADGGDDRLDWDDEGGVAGMMIVVGMMSLAGIMMEVMNF